MSTKISEPRRFPKVVAGSERQYNEARLKLVVTYIYLVVLVSIITVRVEEVKRKERTSAVQNASPGAILEATIQPWQLSTSASLDVESCRG